jgi:uncharacterized membrane protein
VSGAEWVKLLHVFVAFWFVAGLVGRAVTLQRARRSTNLESMGELLGAGGVFDRLMVVPGSIAVLVAGLATMWAEGRSLFQPHQWWLGVSLLVFLSTVPLVPLVFIPSGKRFDAAFQNARQVGSVTPELTAAYRDPKVRFAHTYEALAVACVIALMVTQPF